MAKNYFSKDLIGSASIAPWAEARQGHRPLMGSDLWHFIKQTEGSQNPITQAIPMPGGEFILQHGQNAYSSFGEKLASGTSPGLIKSISRSAGDDLGYMFDHGDFIISPAGASVRPPSGGNGYIDERRNLPLSNAIANLTQGYLPSYLVDQDVVPAYSSWLSGADTGGMINVSQNPHPFFPVTHDYGRMENLIFNGGADRSPSAASLADPFPYSIVMGHTPHGDSAQPLIHAMFEGKPVVTHPDQIIDSVNAVAYPPMSIGGSHRFWGGGHIIPANPEHNWQAWMGEIDDLGYPPFRR